MYSKENSLNLVNKFYKITDKMMLKAVMNKVMNSEILNNCIFSDLIHSKKAIYIF